MKQCFKCLQEKPFSEFYRHGQTKSLLFGKCKQCTREDARRNRMNRLEYYREYDCKRAQLPHRKALALKNTRKARKRIHRYTASHDAVDAAIKKGKLVRQPCQMCGTKDWVAAHHDDYSQPLAVMWLCPVHHKARHAFLDFLESCRGIGGHAC